MRTVILLAGATLLVAGCNQTQATDSNASVNAAAAAKPKVRHYCFYTKEASKDWSASRDAQGNVTVKGKAHLDDVRYKAELGQPEIAGTAAKLWLTTTTNSSYAAPDNWWNVSFTIPNSAVVTDVTVNCDKDRVFADLKVKPGK